nr:hypothetical protein GCM10025730_22040 [Promicromonospora thailandica]
MSEDSRERLAMAWNRDIETTVDDHWFRAREAAARQPGSAAPEGPDLTPDGQLSWDERFEDLASTLPHRITHELEKDIVLGQAARDFHHLAGHPDDLRGQRYDVSVKQFDDIAKDFRTDTLTQYDRIWAPAEADSRAWLAHEASRADLFATTLARAQESPLQAPPRPAPRPDADAPVTGTRSEATPLRIDPDLGRQPDSAESSSGRSTSLGDQQTHETAHSARTDDRAASGSPFRMDEAQIQVVREEPVSQTLSSSGPRQGFGEPRTTAAEAHGPLGALRDQPPVRPAGQGDYGEEFGSTLRTDPAYAHGAAAQELYTARLDVLRQQYVDARTAMDVNGPADAAQVEELRRGVTDAAGRLRAESAMIADTVREFHDRYAELGRELSHDLGARIWYTRQISSVEDEFRAALTNQGVVALAGLERHFSAQAQAVRAAAHTDLAGPDARSQDWRSAVWQTRREQLDATYREALAHAAQEYPATVAEATSTLPTTDGSAADVLHDPDSSSAAVHAEHLAQVRARFHEALDHAQDSVTAGIVSRTAHQETADEHLTPEAALLAAFEIEDPALTETAAAVLRAEFDGALRATAAAQPAPAESVPEQASPDWDGWLARQVEDLPVRLALEAARAAAVAEARDLGETMGRAWESALPVPSPIFVKVFDIMPGPVPAVLREAVVDAYVADVTTRFDDAFAGLTAAGSARGLLGTRLQEWHLFSRQATERLDMWFPVALAGRRAVSVAERHFDQHLAGLEPAAPLSTHQAQRLRHEFAVRAQEAFTQIFAGHTGEASDLTARTWRWEAVLSGLTRDVPDQVAFEATAATSLHEAGQSFQRLSRGHDLDTDRLEELAVGYRRDWFHELRTVWAPPGLPETWLDHEEQTDDAFTGGLTDLWTTEAEPEWQKSSQSIPREDGGPVYCVEAAPVCFAPYRTERQEPPR